MEENNNNQSENNNDINSLPQENNQQPILDKSTIKRLEPIGESSNEKNSSKTPEVSPDAPKETDTSEINNGSEIPTQPKQPINTSSVYPSATSVMNANSTINQIETNTSNKLENQSAGQLVLQWLTYAFWGWTLLALSSLIFSIVFNFVADTETGSFTPYAIASVLVLLPISFVTDYFYSKNESSKKTGVAMAIMVIHAVLFALFGIGFLIMAVISIIMIITNSGGNNLSLAWLITSLIITTLYVITFIRTLYPPKLSFVQKYYKLTMIAVSGLFIILGVLGPIANERITKNDRLIENNLYSVNTSINNYIRKNEKLPASLNDIELNGDSKILVEKNLVVYKPEKSNDQYSNRYSTDKTVKYQLCVKYTKEKKDTYSSSYDNPDSDGYYDYLSYYGEHPAGEVCYKLKDTVYNYNDQNNSDYEIEPINLNN
jgi:hypothetical protein